MRDRPGTRDTARLRVVAPALPVILVLAAAAVLGIGGPAPDARLDDMNDLDDLRVLFNRNEGVPRIVLLLSPT